jgi:hypothetical protein
LFSRPKTFADNVALCNKSGIGGTYEVGACDQLAKYNDYFKKNMIGDIDAKSFYPKVADPLFTSIEASRIRGTPKQYLYNGNPLSADELVKIKRYQQIGERVLPKYDNGKKIGYVLKDTPLTYEEVSSKPPAELEAFINSLPEMSGDNVNKIYQDRGTKI